MLHPQELAQGIGRRDGVKVLVTNSATFPNSDIRLAPTSAAIAAAVAAAINPTNDFGMNPQPRAGQSTRSIGAAQ